MRVAVVLGNRMKDDGSLSDIMLSRLNLTLKLDSEQKIDKFIVSGGVANKVAGVAEATKMAEWLVNNGISEERIIKEDKSLTTVENAKFSVPIAEEIGATEIVLVTSTYHVTRLYLPAGRLFQKALKKYPNIKLAIYAGE